MVFLRKKLRIFKDSINSSLAPRSPPRQHLHPLPKPRHPSHAPSNHTKFPPAKTRFHAPRNNAHRLHPLARRYDRPLPRIPSVLSLPPFLILPIPDPHHLNKERITARSRFPRPRLRPSPLQRKRRRGIPIRNLPLHAQLRVPRLAPRTLRTSP